MLIRLSQVDNHGSYTFIKYTMSKATSRKGFPTRCLTLQYSKIFMLMLENFKKAKEESAKLFLDNCTVHSSLP